MSLVSQCDKKMFILNSIYYQSESFSSASKMYYNIRIIEAIDEGVCYGILDDKRCDDKPVTLLRYPNLSTDKIEKISAFINCQKGKDYNLDFAKDTSISEKDWYCSEPVWAGYKSVGIDIEVASLGEPGITPHDIKNCNKLVTVNYK